MGLGMSIQDRILRLLGDTGGRLSQPQMALLLGHPTATIRKHIDYLVHKKLVVYGGYGFNDVRMLCLPENRVKITR